MYYGRPALGFPFYCLSAEHWSPKEPHLSEKSMEISNPKPALGMDPLGYTFEIAAFSQFAACFFDSMPGNPKRKK